eukprot:TRINITY_DN196_c0_g2_i1.p5 TRINITY_DN196_c0_g2~~TRINITY_DN196_c0_g2_i1.p5  ORF type:complete len:156 (-),score=8.48 TRINITY_DN196_c0_g2_i1:931-1398(-)
MNLYTHVCSLCQTQKIQANTAMLRDILVEHNMLLLLSDQHIPVNKPVNKRVDSQNDQGGQAQDAGVQSGQTGEQQNVQSQQHILPQQAGQNQQQVGGGGDGEEPPHNPQNVELPVRTYRQTRKKQYASNSGLSIHKMLLRMRYHSKYQYSSYSTL